MKSARRLSLLILPLLAAAPVAAQPVATSPAATAESCLKPWYTPFLPPYRSVEVMADGRATFRICAPEAHQVYATSPDAPAVIAQGFPPGTPLGLALTRDATGMWSGSTDRALPPGTYRYGFRVDGVRTADPYASRWSPTRFGTEAVLEVPGAGAQAYAYDPAIPHGALSIVTYPSAAIGAPRRAYIYTPPGYEGGGARRYPVLYLVHGAGDSDASWSTIGHANLVLDNLIAAGKAVPMIVVMPDGHAAASDRGMSDDNRVFGADLVGDLIPYVDRHYRTIPTAEARGMAGLSMGGWHTLQQGVTRPGTFHWIGVFSMGLGVGSAAKPGAPPYDQAAIDAYAAANAAALRADGQAMRLVYYAIGRDDAIYPAVKPTRALWDRFGIHYVYHESAGGHTWDNWRDYLADFVPRLFRRDQPAAARRAAATRASSRS